MSQAPQFYEVAVTLHFVCRSQEDYDERMAQVSAWIEDLQQITGEGEMTVEVQV